MTVVLTVDPVHPDPEAIARAAECLRSGGLVAFPTETVYGLGVHALDPAAVRRLFAAKERPANDPLIVHVADAAQAAPLVADGLPDRARALAGRFWPGPLTLVMPRSAQVPDEVTAGLPSVAVRVPSHPVAHALIARAAIPIAAPSANLFSRPSPTRAAHVLQDLEGRLDIVLDSGPTDVGVESTVLDLTGPEPVVLRPGAITIEMLRDVLPQVRVRHVAGPSGGTAALPSPGLLSRHYAPRVPLSVYEGPRALAQLADDAAAAAARGERIGLLLPLDAVERFQHSAFVVADLGSTSDLTAAAARLYAALRELDAAGVQRILALGFPEHGLGAALRDRLRRAAAGRIIQT